MRRAELPDPSLWEIAEAGGPILADESVDDVIPLPKQLVGEGTFLMLRVVGESMINAAITWREGRRREITRSATVTTAGYE